MIAQLAILPSSGINGSLIASVTRQPSHVVRTTRSFKPLRDRERPSSKLMPADNNLSNGNPAARTHMVAAPMGARAAVGAKRSLRAPTR